MTEWGDWVDQTPLTEVREPVTPQTCVMMRPRLRQLDSGLWEASPVRYRREVGSGWHTDCRLAAWARPHGDQDHAQAPLWFALTFLTTRFVAPSSPELKPVHSRPCWRTAWMVFDGELVEPVELPARYPSEYWHQELSRELARFALELAHTPARGGIPGA